jgi:hypothetical protein
MLSEQLNILRDNILSITGMDTGHANVQLVYNKNIIVDQDGQQYAGITDTEGNTFYVRSVKDTTFNQISRCANIRYKAKSPCEIVFTIRKMDVEKFAEGVIPHVSKAGLISKLSTDSAAIYIKETGDKSPTIDFKEWQLVKIEFSVIYAVNSIAK